MERAPGRQQSERDSLQRLVSSREKSFTKEMSTTGLEKEPPLLGIERTVRTVA